MCNCPNSPWAQNALNFLEINRNNANEQWHTVDFLLNSDHCGIDHRTTIERILAHLREQGINFDREEFQQSILGDLKRQGIVATLPYPGRPGGVFIPCNENEVMMAAEQILRRVNSEIENIAGIARGTRFQNLFDELAQTLREIRQNFH